MAKLKQELDNLRQKDAKALQQELSEARQSLQKARVDLAFGRLPKVATVSHIRRQIARIQTVIEQKEAANA